jgi:MFS family permease
VTDLPDSGVAERSPLREPGFLVALVIAVVVALGFGLIVPVLPLFARGFGVGLFAVTMVISAFAAVRLVSNLYAGSLADRFGSRRIVGAGALIVALSSLLTAGAPSFLALLLLRAAGGFGSALFFNALLSLVVRSVPGDQRGRAVGLLQGAFMVGMAFGPSVGGLLAEPLGLRWPFVIYAGFCAAAGVVALVYLPRESAGRETAGDAAASTRRGVVATWSAARRLCADPAFVTALVMMMAFRWSATGLRFSLVPVFGAEVVGASEGVVGMALTLAALAQLAVVWPIGRAADRAGRRRVSIPAFCAFAVVVAGFPLAGTVPAFLMVMMVFGIGTGATAFAPPAIVGDVTPEDETGLGVGVLNTAGDLGTVVGPLASGLLADLAGYGWGFGASAGLLAVAGVAVWRMRETLPARAPAG